MSLGSDPDGGPRSWAKGLTFLQAPVRSVPSGGGCRRLALHVLAVFRTLMPISRMRALAGEASSKGSRSSWPHARLSSSEGAERGLNSWLRRVDACFLAAALRILQGSASSAFLCAPAASPRRGIWGLVLAAPASFRRACARSCHGRGMLVHLALVRARSHARGARVVRILTVSEASADAPQSSAPSSVSSGRPRWCLRVPLGAPSCWPRREPPSPASSRTCPPRLHASLWVPWQKSSATPLKRTTAAGAWRMGGAVFSSEPVPKSSECISVIFSRTPGWPLPT